MSVEKNFRIPAAEIKTVVWNFRYCFATGRITVDGMKVGYMYRESPQDRNDSGWNFLAGDESDEYLDNPDNLAIYEVNTIANYDPAIVEVLETRSPCAFERDGSTGKFVSVPPPDPKILK